MLFPPSTPCSPFASSTLSKYATSLPSATPQSDVSGGDVVRRAALDQDDSRASIDIRHVVPRDPLAEIEPSSPFRWAVLN